MNSAGPIQKRGRWGVLFLRQGGDGRRMGAMEATVEPVVSKPKALLRVVRGAFRGAEVQVGWGRVVKEELANQREFDLHLNRNRFYDPELARHPWARGDSEETGSEIETLRGFVDRVYGSTAYLTLHTPDGETLTAEYSAAELAALGIHERRSFECSAIESNGAISFKFKPLPQPPIDDAKRRAMLENITERFADHDTSDDY